MVDFYVENGFKAREIENKDGEPYQGTAWHLDGAVAEQFWDSDSDGTLSNSGEHKASPPWWWNVKDQTEPTAPWIKKP